jgi:hypothetical protein
MAAAVFGSGAWDMTIGNTVFLRSDRPNKGVSRA